MKNVTFNPDIKILRDSDLLIFSESEIMAEPMLYSADLKFAYENGGELTSSMLDRISDEVQSLMYEQALLGYHPVIDTKVVMLMQGMTPCIPGWHCDGVLRDETTGQPDLNTLNEPIYHFVGAINSRNTANTEIMTEPLSLDVDHKKVWGSVDNSIKKLSDYSYTSLKSGDIVRFTRSTLHRGTPAKSKCWRFFFRLSFYHGQALNQIRKQVQVYTTDGGW
jgi:hypothetical protein